MTATADVLRAVLMPFLLVSGAALLLLLVFLLVARALRVLASKRRRRLVQAYQPIVDAALHGQDSGPALTQLRTVPREHRPILAGLLTDATRSVRGSAVARARDAAGALGLIDDWEASLDDRRWWIRADAAHALGLLEHRPAVPRLVAALNDPYEEVRAAAVHALGRIGHPAAIPALVAALSQQSRHQRVRIVEALQHFGLDAAAPLLAHADAHGGDVATVVELLGTLEATAAIERLRTWTAHADAAIRAAALRALGRIGIEDRTYYHVLRALSDEIADVRAAAAWALGRSGRRDAAPYLAERLQDEWNVAAESARALRHLGAEGRRVLENAAAAHGSELARQMLWEVAAGAGA